jgi:hypothetical protein
MNNSLKIQDSIFDDFDAPQERQATINANGTALKKHELLLAWCQLQPDQDPLAHMKPITGEGSSYGGDGIRICGSEEFVSAVLSRFQDFLDAENDLMILKASHNIVKPTEIGGKAKEYKYSGGHVVYIQLGERSGATIGAAEATDRYIDRVPGLREAIMRGKVAFYMWIGMSRQDAEARAYKVMGKGRGR